MESTDVSQRLLPAHAFQHLSCGCLAEFPHGFHDGFLQVTEVVNRFVRHRLSREFMLWRKAVLQCAVDVKAFFEFCFAA